MGFTRGAKKAVVNMLALGPTSRGLYRKGSEEMDSGRIPALF